RVFFCAIPENRRAPKTWAQNQGFFRLPCRPMGARALQASRQAPPLGAGGRGAATDAAPSIRSRVRERGPRGLPLTRLYRQDRRSARGDGAQWGGQILSAAHGGGPGAAAARSARARGR